MNRQDVLSLLDELVKTEALRRHLTAVSAAMRHYARRFGEDEEEWALVGLLHDCDWDAAPRAEAVRLSSGEAPRDEAPTPQEHPFYGARLLKERGFPEHVVRAVLAHGNDTGVPRQSLMEKALFAVDELSSFIVAVALVRPSKSLEDLEPSSVRRKMKDKAFARAVKREDITAGTQELGIELDEHIATVIEGLKPVAAELGLSPANRAG